MYKNPGCGPGAFRFQSEQTDVSCSAERNESLCSCRTHLRSQSSHLGGLRCPEHIRPQHPPTTPELSMNSAWTQHLLLLLSMFKSLLLFVFVSFNILFYKFILISGFGSTLSWILLHDIIIIVIIIIVIIVFLIWIHFFHNSDVTNPRHHWTWAEPH